MHDASYILRAKLPAIKIVGPLGKSRVYAYLGRCLTLSPAGLKVRLRVKA